MNRPFYKQKHNFLHKRNNAALFKKKSLEGLLTQVDNVQKTVNDLFAYFIDFFFTATILRWYPSFVQVYQPKPLVVCYLCRWKQSVRAYRQNQQPIHQLQYVSILRSFFSFLLRLRLFHIWLYSRRAGTNIYLLFHHNFWCVNFDFFVFWFDLMKHYKFVLKKTKSKYECVFAWLMKWSC